MKILSLADVFKFVHGSQHKLSAAFVRYTRGKLHSICLILEISSVEPIAIEPRTVTTPANDSINWDTFEYKKLHDNTRVLFDLDLKLRRISRRSQDQMFPEKPAQVPVLLGDAFAIRKDVFFDIGGFDEGMKVSGGENIELSLKVWLSGGQILEVPCSRVGQGQRLHDLYRTKEFEGFNLKRIAEVSLTANEFPR